MRRTRQMDGFQLIGWSSEGYEAATYIVRAVAARTGNETWIAEFLSLPEADRVAAAARFLATKFAFCDELRNAV